MLESMLEPKMVWFLGARSEEPDGPHVPEDPDPGTGGPGS